MKVHTRNKKFTGTRVGIRFVNGVGETSDEKAAAQLRRLGYTVEADVPDEGDDANPLAHLKLDELKAHAAELGIDLGDAKTKAEIKDVITEATTSPADA